MANANIHYEELADELKLREDSPFHKGLTAVAHKNNRDVCWCCFEPIGTKFVDLPMQDAWIRICERSRCERTLLRESKAATGNVFAVPGPKRSGLVGTVKSKIKNAVSDAIDAVMRR